MSGLKKVINKNMRIEVIKPDNYDFDPKLTYIGDLITLAKQQNVPKHDPIMFDNEYAYNSCLLET